jgi:general secretion pathway protein H
MVPLAAMVKTPTSAISLDERLGLRHHSTTSDQRGFTLIELLVVLAIGALLAGLVPSAFDRLREVSQYRDTVRAMVLDLRQARQQALTLGQFVAFEVNLSDRQFGIEGRTKKPLPAFLEVKTTVGSQGEPGNNLPAVIGFLPDGGSTGGTIELVRQSGAGVRIRVDWLFGKVTQEPRTP